MYLRQLSKELPPLIDGDATSEPLAIEIQSAPGVGKSDTMRQLVKEWSARDGVEWGIGVAFLATYTPVDLLGYMVPMKREVTNADGTTETITVADYTMPPWMFSIDGRPLNSFKRFVLVLDEYDKGEPDVKKTSAELLLHGAIGPWRLHNGRVIIACSNRSEDRSGGTKTFDFVINRRGLIHIQPDFLSWNKWAIEHGVASIMRLYAQKKPQIIFSGNVPKEQGPFCTPRSFMAFANYLERRKVGNDYRLDDEDDLTTVLEIGSGIIGEPAARDILTFFKLRHETPDFDDIVAKPMDTMLPQPADAKMLICYECALKITAATAKPVVEYIERLPKEYAVAFVKAAAQRDHRLMQDKTFMGWVQKNASLMNAIA